MARILEDEIASSLRAVAYARLNDADLLVALNVEDIEPTRTDITGKEIQNATVKLEYSGLSDIKKEQYLKLIAIESIAEQMALDVIEDIFSLTSQTYSNLGRDKLPKISIGKKVGWGVVTEKDLRMHTLGRMFPR